MDNIKLKEFCCILVLIVIFINCSCNASKDSKVFEKIELKKWNAVTENFMIDNCASFDEFRKPLEPIMVNQNGVKFHTIVGYIQFRLSFRKIILDELSKIDTKDVRKITIEEYYQRNNWSSARIIISNNISKKKTIYSVNKDKKMRAYNDEEISNFVEYNWENDCEVFMKYTPITQMTIVTDFLLTDEYVVRRVSLFE